MALVLMAVAGEAELALGSAAGLEGLLLNRSRFCKLRLFLKPISMNR